MPITQVRHLSWYWECLILLAILGVIWGAFCLEFFLVMLNRDVPKNIAFLTFIMFLIPLIPLDVVLRRRQKEDDRRPYSQKQFPTFSDRMLQGAFLSFGMISYVLFFSMFARPY